MHEVRLELEDLAGLQEDFLGPGFSHLTKGTHLQSTRTSLGLPGRSLLQAPSSFLVQLRLSGRVCEELTAKQQPALVTSCQTSPLLEPTC